MVLYVKALAGGYGLMALPKRASAADARFLATDAGDLLIPMDAPIRPGYRDLRSSLSLLPKIRWTLLTLGVSTLRAYSIWTIALHKSQRRLATPRKRTSEPL